MDIVYERLMHMMVELEEDKFSRKKINIWVNVSIVKRLTEQEGNQRQGESNSNYL